jgi:hypothetical protein
VLVPTVGLGGALALRVALEVGLGLGFQRTRWVPRLIALKAAGPRFVAG